MIAEGRGDDGILDLCGGRLQPAHSYRLAHWPEPARPLDPEVTVAGSTVPHSGLNLMTGARGMAHLWPVVEIIESDSPTSLLRG